jgi:hypothetical protein
VDDNRDFVRGAAEPKARGAYSVPSGELPYLLREMNREAQPTQVFRNSYARVNSMAPKQSPWNTQPHALTRKEDPASSVWTKATRGSFQNSLRQPGPHEDRWVKAMRRGFSPDAQGERKLKTFSTQRQMAAVQPAEPTHMDEVKAGSDPHFVQAQVKTSSHSAIVAYIHI